MSEPKKNQSLPREERLKSKKSIEELFKKSSSFYLFPFLVKYKCTTESRDLHRVLFAVPKKHHKKAVDRNKIKRRTREAYRLNKSILTSAASSLDIGLLYQSKELLPYDQLQEKLITLLHRLVKESAKGGKG